MNTNTNQPAGVITLDWTGWWDSDFPAKAKKIAKCWGELALTACDDPSKSGHPGKLVANGGISAEQARALETMLAEHNRTLGDTKVYLTHMRIWERLQPLTAPLDTEDVCVVFPFTTIDTEYNALVTGAYKLVRASDIRDVEV